MVKGRRGSADKHKVKLFLTLFKGLAQDNFSYVNRATTIKTLAKFNLLPSQLKDILMGLTVEDYCEGPLPCLNIPDETVWIFGYNLATKELYIKLKATTKPPMALCISFHIAQRKMRFPYATR